MRVFVLSWRFDISLYLRLSMMILCGSHNVFYTTIFLLVLLLSVFNHSILASNFISFFVFPCSDFGCGWVRKTKNENISAQYHETFIHTSFPYTQLLTATLSWIKNVHPSMSYPTHAAAHLIRRTQYTWRVKYMGAFRRSLSSSLLSCYSWVDCWRSNSYPSLIETFNSKFTK